MRLVLLRHADALDDAGRPDAERRLSGQGRGDAVRIGGALAARGVRPDLIVSSPANRALSTVVLAAPAMGYGIDRIVTDPGLYQATPQELREAARRHGGAGHCLLLAGHNPGLRQLGLSLGVPAEWTMPKAHAALFAVDAWDRLEGARFEGMVLPQPPPKP
ncbi:MAG TPA: histidine phosphatase family protein [Candidatus Thermoplasmatota archaeon]|nr:histidine phosphatase family protein [Candidatus Thermoplasmatota archaeon]